MPSQTLDGQNIVGTQNVWEDEEGNRWIWYGMKNQYVRYNN